MSKEMIAAWDLDTSTCNKLKRPCCPIKNSDEDGSTCFDEQFDSIKVPRSCCIMERGVSRVTCTDALQNI